MSSGGSVKRTPKLAKLIATRACHKSVRAGDPLTYPKMISVKAEFEREIVDCEGSGCAGPAMVLSSWVCRVGGLSRVEGQRSAISSRFPAINPHSLSPLFVLFILFLFPSICLLPPKERSHVIRPNLFSPLSHADAMDDYRDGRKRSLLVRPDSGRGRTDSIVCFSY